MNTGFWEGRSVFVTGGSGFLGGWVTRKLIERRAEVVVLVRDVVPRSMLFSDNDISRVNTVHGSIEDLRLLRRTFSEYSVASVFHLAAQSYPAVSWQRPIETLETNVIGTANVLEAVRRLDSKVRVVVAGSSAEYGTTDPQLGPISEGAPLLPLHPYGVSKVATDLLAYQYWAGFGLDAVRVRIFNCTGPRKVGDALSDFVRRTVWLERHNEANVIRDEALPVARRLGLCAVAQIARHVRTHEDHRHIEHGHVDALATPGALALEQRRCQCKRAGHAGRVVDHRSAQFHGMHIGRPRHGHDTGGRLDHMVVGRLPATRTMLAEG